MKKKIIVSIFFSLIIVFLFVAKCEAKDLDKINNYTVTVNPRSDGSLDINYHIEWEVLDSTTEGPLEWVKIGIPNQHVNNIKKISNNIKKIKYIYDSGNFVRIDFKNKYKAGDIVVFEFSIHQNNMYSIDNSAGKVSYKFIAGWFEDINVEQAIIKWKAKDIEKHNGKIQDDYIIWTKSLKKNQKITAKVEYSVSRFKLDYSKQAQKSNSMISSIIITVILVVVFIMLILIEIISPSYYYHGGYGYYERFYHPHHYLGGFGHRPFGGHHGGGGSSSCACACACAGGGRAGCAKKDFYGTNLKTKNLKKNI